jgi:polyhydroxyalkanoate synthesis regulator phasin
MNIKHLNNSELRSLVGNGGCAGLSESELIDLVDDLVERLDQAAVDTQDVIDDISNVFDEFETAYNTVSDDIDAEITDEYNDELKTLKSTIEEYL